MNISKINNQIAEFCTASGFEFGGTQVNMEVTAKLVRDEFKEWESETHQTKACKEAADIAYISLSECYRYGYQLREHQVYDKPNSVDFRKLINSFLDALNIGNAWGVSFDLAQIVEENRKFIEACNFDFEKVFDALHTSNMSKFLTKLEDVQPSIDYNLSLTNEDGTQRYAQVGYIEQGGLFVIKCLQTGKILKGIHFKECDLSNCQKLS